MSKRPLISIVIATYDCAADLSGCLESIFNQQTEAMELLIADGASTDGTVDAIKKHGDRIAWWCSEKDSGIYDAWNKAIPQCQGTWLWFIGADDRLLEGAVRQMCEQAGTIKNESVGFIYFPLVAKGSHETASQTWGKPAAAVAWQLKHGMPIHMPHSSMLHRRRLFEEHGLFDTGFRSAGDYAFVLRVTGGNAKAFRFLQGRPVLTKGLDGISSVQRTLNISEFRLARLANGMNGVTLPWLLIYARSWLRDLISR